MELEQLNCCGLLELVDLRNQDYYEKEVSTPSTDPNRPEWDRMDYSTKPIARLKGIRQCKRDVQAKLRNVAPKGRVIFASTVAGMPRETEALRQLRWKRVKHFQNGNSGNWVTVWMKHLKRRGD